jgi:hypothetical protein
MRNPILAHLLLLISLLAGQCAMATIYYVSPTGSDSNSGTSAATAWQNISRVNQISSSLQPGDKVLFQRGGTYRGKLTISSNGTAAAKIEVGAYGTGARPIIKGSVAVVNWTNHSGNIWRAPISQSVKHVYVNGQLMTIARYPNSGWLRVDQGTSTSTTDSELTQGSGYWTGATAVIRTTNWSYDTARVTAFSGNTLTHTGTGNNLHSQNWGYFLRNKLSELDMPGEWFFDSAAGQLYLWCPANADPNQVLVEASVVDNGIFVSWQRQHIKITEIAMQHQFDAALRLSGSTQLEAANCSFSEVFQAIKSTGNNQNFHHLDIQRTYGTAVHLMDSNSSITNSTFNNICVEPGLGENNWGYFGIRATGAGLVITDNVLEDIGYIGIGADGNALIERNVVRRALLILNDGGGIAIDNAVGLIIRNNIVADISGNIESTAPNFQAYHPICHGIYFGNISIKNTLVKSNTVANCLGSGVHVDHTMVSQGNRIEDNVLFNNTVQLSISDFSNYNGPVATAPYHVPAFNDVYTGNVLYSLTKDQLCMQQLHVYATNWVDYGTFNNNYYFNPYNDRSIRLFNTFGGFEKYFTLERWQAEQGEDLNSSRSLLYLADQAVTEVIGSDLVPNGAFGSNITGWSGWPTQAQLTHDQNNLDNGSLRVSFTNNASYNTFNLKHNTLVPIQTGNWYRLRFSIVSPMHGEVVVGFKGQTQLSGPNMEGKRTIPFSTQRRDVTIFFQSTITDQGYCSLTNSYLEGIYSVDNIQLHRVSVTPLDPLEKQQLFVNDGPTALTVTLAGCWSDVQGDLHTGSIVLPAYSSVVLIKEEDSMCISTGNDDQAPRHADDGFAYPNPAAAGTSLQLSSSFSSPWSLSAFNMEGKLVWSDKGAAEHRTTNVPDTMAPGTYLLLVQSDEGTLRQRLVIL